MFDESFDAQTQLHRPFAFYEEAFDSDDNESPSQDLVDVGLTALRLTRQSPRVQGVSSLTSKFNTVKQHCIAPGTVISYHWKFISPGDTPEWADETILTHATAAEDISTLDQTYPLQPVS